jgi:predicted transglutaminase-like protease
MAVTILFKKVVNQFLCMSHLVESLQALCARVLEAAYRKSHLRQQMQSVAATFFAIAVLIATFKNLWKQVHILKRRMLCFKWLFFRR